MEGRRIKHGTVKSRIQSTGKRGHRHWDLGTECGTDSVRTSPSCHIAHPEEWGPSLCSLLFPALVLVCIHLTPCIPWFCYHHRKRNYSLQASTFFLLAIALKFQSVCPFNTVSLLLVFCFLFVCVCGGVDSECQGGYTKNKQTTHSKNYCSVVCTFYTQRIVKSLEFLMGGKKKEKKNTLVGTQNSTENT